MVIKLYDSFFQLFLLIQTHTGLRSWLARFGYRATRFLSLASAIVSQTRRISKKKHYWSFSMLLNWGLVSKSSGTLLLNLYKIILNSALGWGYYYLSFSFLIVSFFLYHLHLGPECVQWWILFCYFHFPVTFIVLAIGNGTEEIKLKINHWL